MNDPVLKLRAVNASLDDYFTTAASQHGTFGKDQRWECLARVAALLPEVAPILNVLQQQSSHPDIEQELERYTIHLHRLSREFHAALIDLGARRTQLWQEEQALRTREQWHSHL